MPLPRSPVPTMAYRRFAGAARNPKSAIPNGASDAPTAAAPVTLTNSRRLVEVVSDIIAPLYSAHESITLRQRRYRRRPARLRGHVASRGATGEGRLHHPARRGHPEAR